MMGCSTFFVCPSCGKCHDIDYEIKDGATVRCPETGYRYHIRLIWDARKDETDPHAWIRKAAANVTKLVAGASLKGTTFSNTQIADIIQQEYENKEKQDADSQLG